MPHHLQPATLLKKRLWRRCFPASFSKFLGVSSKCKLTASHQNQKHKIHSNMFSSLPKGNFFFVHLLREKLWVQCKNIICLVKMQIKFFLLQEIKNNESTAQNYHINYLLHIVVMLTNSKVFKILFLLCLRG